MARRRNSEDLVEDSEDPEEGSANNVTHDAADKVEVIAKQLFDGVTEAECRGPGE